MGAYERPPQEASVVGDVAEWIKRKLRKNNPGNPYPTSSSNKSEEPSLRAEMSAVEEERRKKGGV